MLLRAPRNTLIAMLVVLVTAQPVVAAMGIRETGSTLVYPAMTEWIAHYLPTHPDVNIEANATGSGAGIADALSGASTIGGSDVYLTDAQLKGTRLINVPLAVSAQAVYYNISQLRGGRPLRLSGSVLADVYSGAITAWDDPKIAGMNLGVTLPHHAIVPIRRVDGSGDTFLFTQYLSLTSANWAKKIGLGIRVEWPAVDAMQVASGNADMIEKAKDIAYSIAYVGISYANRANAAGLEPAALLNRDGSFVEPNSDAVTAAVEAGVGDVPPDGRRSLVFMPGARAYPLVNFEYAIVNLQQSSPEMATALRAFLRWIVSSGGGNAAELLHAFHFEPLAPSVRAIAQREIDQIRGP